MQLIIPGRDRRKLALWPVERTFRFEHFTPAVLNRPYPIFSIRYCHLVQVTQKSPNLISCQAIAAISRSMAAAPARCSSAIGSALPAASVPDFWRFDFLSQARSPR